MKRFMVLAGAVALVVAACGGGETAETTTSSTTPPTTAATTTSTTIPTPQPEAQAVSSYMLTLTADGSGPYLVPLHRTLRPGVEPDVSEAVNMLLAGETFTEAGFGIGTEIPRDTSLRNVTTVDGVATVDLSGSFEAGGGSSTMLARLAQVVYTATQFEEVSAVTLALDGEPVEVFSSEGIDITDPMDRLTFADFRGPVFVESPAWGDTVGSSFTVTGLAATDEDVLRCALIDWDGLIVHEASLDVPAADGVWAPFSMDIDMSDAEARLHPAGSFDLTLAVWEGESQANVMEYPLFYVEPALELHGLSGDIELQKGQALTVFLEGNPTTGFGWFISSDIEPVLTLLAESFVQDSNLLGSPGLFRFDFEATQPGTVDLILRYERSFEDVAPLEVASAVVTVR